jgi:hypothetical protein
MAKINLTGDIKNVFSEHRKKVERAEIVALNRAGRSALAQTVMFIRKVYKIKSSDLKNEIKISTASKGRKRFRLTVTHKGLALVKFGNAAQTKAGVSVAIKKGARQSFKSAFITEVGKGRHRGVFKREGKKRLPIKELFGPSAMQLMSSDQAAEYINKIFQEKF